jgi:hypothetical protein
MSDSPRARDRESSTRGGPGVAQVQPALVVHQRRVEARRRERFRLVTVMASRGKCDDRSCRTGSKAAVEVVPGAGAEDPVASRRRRGDLLSPRGDSGAPWQEQALGVPLRRASSACRRVPAPVRLQRAESGAAGRAPRRGARRAGGRYVARLDHGLQLDAASARGVGHRDASDSAKGTERRGSGCPRDDRRGVLRP